MISQINLNTRVKHFFVSSSNQSSQDEEEANKNTLVLPELTIKKERESSKPKKKLEESDNTWKYVAGTIAVFLAGCAGLFAYKNRGAKESKRSSQASNNLQNTGVSQNTETTRSRTQRTEELSIDDLTQSQYTFDELKAEQVIKVIEDSLKYGGSIYDHLTGKNPKLEKGIDYNTDEDGGINRSSLTAAYDKLANLFLQNGGQAWINASEELAKKHEIATQEESVSVSRSDGTTEMKNRYIRPYRRTDGWIYYESNYYDKTIQQMTEPNREKTQYRVYFNVENEHVVPVFQDIINNLESDPTLQKYGFQIKTADLLCKPSNADIGRITGQKDKIVAYFGEEGINRALPILRKYVEENLSKFKAADTLLSMPLTDSNAETIDGISVSSELKGSIYDGTNTRVYKSFNDFQSIIIDLVLDSVIKKVKSDTSLFSYNSPLNEKMNNLNTNQLSRKNDYLRAILSHAEGKQFLLKEIQAKYNEYVKQCGINPCNIAFQES